MLRKLVVGPYQANCYILGCKTTREGVVIDPGDEVFRVVKEISNLGLKIRYILITHGHVDHVGGAEELRKITNAPVWAHPLDAGGLGFRSDGALSDGQVCFYAPGSVFTGDTLFAGSIGRTDFPGGNHDQLIRGVVQKIFTLGDNLRVYPGHGSASTIGREKTTNPFFR